MVPWPPMPVGKGDALGKGKAQKGKSEGKGKKGKSEGKGKKGKFEEVPGGVSPGPPMPVTIGGGHATAKGKGKKGKFEEVPSGVSPGPSMPETIAEGHATAKGKGKCKFSSAQKRKLRRVVKTWQAQIFRENMPGYVADVGATASQTVQRKERKARAEARALLDLVGHRYGITHRHPQKIPSNVSLIHRKNSARALGVGGLGV